MSSSILKGLPVRRSMLWNIAGSVVPLVMGLFAIPVLVEQLGEARFGLLILSWTFVGYVNIFDFGIGRALTQVVAERLGKGRESELSGLIWLALLILLGLGFVVGILVFLFSGLIIDGLKVPFPLSVEAVSAFQLLGLGIPFVVCSSGLRGILEGYQRFDYVNKVRIPLGTLTFFGPLAVLPISTSLLTLTAILVIIRVFGMVAYVVLLTKAAPVLRQFRMAAISEILIIARIGGWITLSNTVAPLMVYFDRFIIGAYISIAAVSYYSIPFEIVTKFLVLPAAIASVFYPTFASTYQSSAPIALKYLERGLWAMLLLLFPTLLVFFSVVEWGLDLWLGQSFALEGAQVARWLTVGVFLNGIAGIPYAYIQGRGRADLTAKFHLAEAPFYFIILVWGLANFGIVGAAIAWTARVAMDLALLLYATAKLFPISGALIKKIASVTLFAIVLFGILALILNILGSVSGLIAAAVISTLAAIALWPRAFSQIR